jgi:ribonucleoside-diphosphate reductase alpha chain
MENVIYTKDEAMKKSLEYFEGDELAASVFVDKYALKDDKGNLLEDEPSKMHKRIAKEFARIEKNKFKNPMSEDEIYSYLENFKWIVPQGSPLAGIGNNYSYQTLGNCFVKGTKVLTINKGVKNIEDVQNDDIVITDNGTTQKVKQLHKNKLLNNTILFKCYRTPNIICTENHEFLSISKEQLMWGEVPAWNNIKYLRVGDYIALPNRLDENITDQFIDISKELDNEIHQHERNYTFYTNVDKCYLETYWSCSNGKICKKEHQHINKIWKIDNDFAYFLGLWYGDGCIFSDRKRSGQRNRISKGNHYKNKIRGITFTFSSKETEIINFVENYGKKLFGINPDSNNNERFDGSYQIVFHSTLIGMIFEKLFGRRCDGKKLYIPIFQWNYNLVNYLTQGLIDSDGCITKDGDLRISLKNIKLIEEFYHLLRSYNYVVGMTIGKSEKNKYARLDFAKNCEFILKSKKYYKDNRKSNQNNPRKHQNILINGRNFVQITNKIKNNKNDEYVYNLGIENVHSYNVEGLICKNCYVLDNVNDSYGGIFYSDQQLGQLMKRRAGVGMDISNIRPKGLSVKNAAKTTDGIAVFMERFSNTCREVAQGGRRGALLLSINIHHPEVSTFINIKKDLKKVTGANISVKLTNDFLNAVEKDEDYEQYWPLEKDKEKQISKKVSAKEIWKQIIDSAWSVGEPGIMFWDTMINNSLSNGYGEIHPAFYDKTTNPCGEIIMGQDSCRLMVVPLHNFVDNPFTKTASFDYEKFGLVVEKAQRLMDDIIDMEIECIDRIITKVKNDPEILEIKKIELDMWKQIKEVCIKGRRTGLGVNALADTLASLNIKYGSDKSFDVVNKIFEKFAIHSMKSSCELAKELGPFPIYNKEIEKKYMSPLLDRIFKASPEVKELHEKYGRRNISLTTCSPTGSISIETRTSSGIEPLFTIKPYVRRKKINADSENVKVDFVDDMGDKWQEYKVYHPYIEKWIHITGKTDLNDSPYYEATSKDIDWERSVKIQAIAQKWITHSISKTLNVPKETSKKVTENVYLTAWKTGCKGITFYRDESRAGVLIDEENSNINNININALKRPKELQCDIYHVNITKKLDKIRTFQYMVMVGLLNGKPYEIFANENGQYDKKLTKGKIVKHSKGNYDLVFEDGNIKKNITKDTTENEDSLTRMISILLRHSIPIHFVVDQLNKVEGDLLCFAKAISRSLKKYIKDGTTSTDECPSCNSKLVFENGCKICKNCGWSAC